MTKKTLKDFLEVYKPKSPDEQKFVDKHVTIKHKDRNGNGDDVFNAANIKTIKRKEERHGYDVGEDEKVYEEVEELDELSQKMVRAYRDKARDDKESAEDDREYYKAHDDNTDDEDKKIRKRTAGIKMAGKKIYGGAKVPVKEDADLDEVLDEAINLLMSIDEKTLTPAEMKKREEVVKAIKRGNPKMDKSMAYAIATKTAKRVAEGVIPTADEPSEHDKKMAQKVRDLLAKEKKPVKEEAEEIDEGIATYDKKGKLVGNYKDLETAKKLKPGHHYAPKGTVLAALDRVGKPVWAPTFKEEVEEIDESAKIAAHLIKRYGDNVRKSHVRSAANDFGVGYVALAHAVRKKLGVNRLEEEQIDEISAAKLTDYTAKASDARGHRDMSTAKLDKRYKSMALAHEKIRQRHAKVPANEEVEVEEAVGDITVKTKSPADAFAQHTNQAKKKVSVPKDPKTGKTLYQKVTQEETELEEGMAMWKVEFPKQHAGKAIDAGTAHVKAQNVSHAHKVMAKRLGVDHKLLKAKVSKSSILPEEADQLDELSKDTLKSYLDKKKVPSGAVVANVNDKASMRKYTNRVVGGVRAAKKLAKEEVEQIDELSKKTLGNYTYKAASELGSKGITTGLKIAADEPTEKNFKKMANRQKGVATAVKKLTKEDIINRTIDKYVPEEVKFTPEERLLKRLNGLSEAHVNTLLSLFEALNKDNQNKMIETVETREGINQLLNFALDNRGE